MVYRRTFALVLVAFAALAIAQDAPFENEIRAFEEADNTSMPKPGGVVFVGSSSIRLWKTLAADFPDVPSINRGFGGSQISDSVGFAERIVTKYKPKAIVFFAGTNDLWSGKSPEQILYDYNAFVTKVRAKLPDVKIAYIALTPAPSRWSKIAQVRQTNDLIRKYSEVRGTRFIDTYSAFLTAEGGPRPELFVGDQLHLKPEGYVIWKERVGPVVREMMAER